MLPPRNVFFTLTFDNMTLKTSLVRYFAVSSCRSNPPTGSAAITFTRVIFESFSAKSESGFVLDSVNVQTQIRIRESSESSSDMDSLVKPIKQQHHKRKQTAMTSLPATAQNPDHSSESTFRLTMQPKLDSVKTNTA